MPTIICPHCKSEYNVSLKVLDKKVRCKECGESFEAKVLRAQMSKPKKMNPMVILGSALGVGLFIIVALIMSYSPEEHPKEEVEEPLEIVEEVKAPVKEVQGPVKTDRELFLEEFLQVVADEDMDRIQKMFSFSSYHKNNRKEGEPHWNDLAELDQVMKKAEYTEQLTDNSAQGGGFIRSSEILSLKESAWNGTEGVVEVSFKNMHNGREQERTYTLRKFGSSLMVVNYTVGAEHGGDLDITEEKPKTLDEKYQRRISPEGKVEEQEFTPDTDEMTRDRLTLLADELVGDSRSQKRKAREKLRDFEKKAIPPLLNKLVGLDMANDDDISTANTVISVLRLITQENFKFAPGLQQATMLESQADDLERSMKRWFGWWNRNKDSWTPPDLGEETEEE